MCQFCYQTDQTYCPSRKRRFITHSQMCSNCAIWPILGQISDRKDLRQRRSTHNVHRSRYWEFACWCSRQNIHPDTASVTSGANFLARLFKKELSYSTICGYRSAISSYYKGVDGSKIGEHPSIVKLLKGVFNSAVPQKASGPEWRLDKVLHTLRREPYEPMAD